jgi:heat shock protein HtpX
LKGLTAEWVNLLRRLPALMYLDGKQKRRAQVRNMLQSVVLIGGIGLITAMSAYALLGPQGIVWSLIAIAFFVVAGPSVAPEAIMRMFKATPVDPIRGAQIYTIVSALAARAELPAVPKIYLVPSETLNAFAIGTPSRCIIGITSGLLARLNEREVAGVLAHEITHVRNNDIWVMSLADVLSRLTRAMSFFALLLLLFGIPLSLMTGQSIPLGAIVLLYFAPTLSSLLQLALSRSREYDADLGGAALTGDPQGLASALSKLERYQGRFWEDFLMPGRRIPVPSVLRTHPETSERIERLKQLQLSNVPPVAAPQFPGPWTSLSAGRPRFHQSGFWF